MSIPIKQYSYFNCQFTISAADTIRTTRYAEKPKAQTVRSVRVQNSSIKRRDKRSSSRRAVITIN